MSSLKQRPNVIKDRSDLEGEPGWRVEHRGRQPLIFELKTVNPRRFDRIVFGIADDERKTPEQLAELGAAPPEILISAVDWARLTDAEENPAPAAAVAAMLASKQLRQLGRELAA
jgi:hypothetical protein